jgi:hypothetical protein
LTGDAETDHGVEAEISRPVEALTVLMTRAMEFA